MTALIHVDEYDQGSVHCAPIRRRARQKGSILRQSTIWKMHRICIYFWVSKDNKLDWILMRPLRQDGEEEQGNQEGMLARQMSALLQRMKE